jgi:hypothetical protein
MVLIATQSYAATQGLAAEKMKMQSQVREDVLDHSRGDRILDFESRAFAQDWHDAIFRFGGDWKFAAGEFPQVGKEAGFRPLDHENFVSSREPGRDGRHWARFLLLWFVRK